MTTLNQVYRCHHPQPYPHDQYLLKTEAPWSPPVGRSPNIANQEITYRGPQPRIPDLVRKDPSEFARLKLTLWNLLPHDATELFKYQVLVDHLQLEEARLVADSFLHSDTPYTDTLEALDERSGRPHQLALQKA